MWYLEIGIWVIGAIVFFAASAQVAAKWQKSFLILGGLWSMFALGVLIRRFVHLDWVWNIWLLLEVVVFDLPISILALVSE